LSDRRHKTFNRLTATVVHSNAPFIRSHRFFRFPANESQKNRFTIISFGKIQFFTSVHLRSPVHVVTPLLSITEINKTIGSSMLIATVVWSNSFQSPSCSNTGQPVLNNSQNTPKNQFLPKSDWPMASMFY